MNRTLAVISLVLGFISTVMLMVPLVGLFLFFATAPLFVLHILNEGDVVCALYVASCSAEGGLAWIVITLYFSAIYYFVLSFLTTAFHSLFPSKSGDAPVDRTCPHCEKITQASDPVCNWCHQFTVSSAESEKSPSH